MKVFSVKLSKTLQVKADTENRTIIEGIRQLENQIKTSEFDGWEVEMCFEALTTERARRILLQGELS